MNFIIPFFIGACLFSPSEASSQKGHHPSPPAQKRAAHSTHNGKSNPNLRRTRQSAPKRQLLISDLATYGVPTFNNIFQLPSEILANFLGAANGIFPNSDQIRGLTGLGIAGPGFVVQQGMDDVVDRTKTFADSGLDALEQVASGFAQKGRNAIDRTTARASGLLDSSLLFGSSSLGAGVQAARGLQAEAKKIADMTQATVRSGESVVLNTVDRVARGSATDGESNPLNSLLNIASIV